MQFKKFTSIENSYRERFINQIRIEGFTDGYVVTEKLHGANFSFWTDGIDFEIASRNQFVDGSFYSCQPVVEKYKYNIKALKHFYPEAKHITVYGELVGPKIQKGVKYGKELEFYGFELTVDDIPVNILHARVRLSQVEIPFVPMLQAGLDLDTALNFANDGDSYILGIENNTMEGIVIQLNKPKYLANGSRVILKSKNDKFKEKSSKSKKPKKDKCSLVNESDLEKIQAYVNSNRMHNVLSKMGVVEIGDFGKVIGAMSKDVIDDMIKDELYDEESKNFNKAVTHTVSTFLKHELLPTL